MRENVAVEVGDSQSSASESRWQDFWSWKTKNQLCIICLLPFVLIIIGCVLLGLYWSGKIPPSANEAVLTCGMVSFFSGFLVCVIANFCDACGVTCSGHDEFPNDTQPNNTLFVDLSELGPSPDDLEYNDDKSESLNTEVDVVGNRSSASEESTTLASEL